MYILLLYDAFKKAYVFEVSACTVKLWRGHGSNMTSTHKGFK